MKFKKKHTHSILDDAYHRYYNKQAITYEAKNNIAISFILVIKTKNKIAIIKKITFLAPLYF